MRKQTLCSDAHFDSYQAGLQFFHQMLGSILFMPLPSPQSFLLLLRREENGYESILTSKSHSFYP